MYLYVCFIYVHTDIWKTILLLETAAKETLYVMSGYEGVVNFSSSLGRQSSNTDHKF